MRIYYKPDMESHPQSMQVPNQLPFLQQLVDGYIEIHHIGKGVLLICNEEGRLKGMKPTLEDPDYGTIVGPVVFAGSRSDHIVALSDKQVEYLKERYGW